MNAFRRALSSKTHIDIQSSATTQFHHAPNIDIPRYGSLPLPKPAGKVIADSNVDAIERGTFPKDKCYRKNIVSYHNESQPALGGTRESSLLVI